MAEYNFSYLSLMFDYIKNDIKKNEDGLVVLLHWLLLKNRFQVLGPGNEVKLFNTFLVDNNLYSL